MSNHALNAQLARRVLGVRVPCFLDETGRVWSMEYGPEQATLTGDTWTYTEQPLQGLKAYVFPDAPALKGLTFSHTVGNISTAGGPASFLTTTTITRLRQLASRALKVRLAGTSRQETAGWWYIYDLSVQITQRDGHHEPVLATLTWTLKEANTPTVPKIGRTAPAVTGGSTGKPGSSTQAKKTSTATRRYTVKAGDSLRGIAGKLLGDFGRWQDLAKLNKISNPNLIEVGQVLTIPAK